MAIPTKNVNDTFPDKTKRTGADDPFLQCYFHVSINSQSVGRFISCSGISYEIEMETYQEGGARGPYFFPAAEVSQRLVLERGVMANDEMVNWFKAAQSGKYEKLNGEIELIDIKGNVRQTWLINNAYPVKYEGPSFNAYTSEVAVTRVELMHNGILPGNKKASAR